MNKNNVLITLIVCSLSFSLFCMETSKSGVVLYDEDGLLDTRLQLYRGALTTVIEYFSDQDENIHTIYLTTNQIFNLINDNVVTVDNITLRMPEDPEERAAIRNRYQTEALAIMAPRMSQEYLYQ